MLIVDSYFLSAVFIDFYHERKLYWIPIVYRRIAKLTFSVKKYGCFLCNWIFYVRCASVVSICISIVIWRDMILLNLYKISKMFTQSHGNGSEIMGWKSPET